MVRTSFRVLAAVLLVAGLLPAYASPRPRAQDEGEAESGDGEAATAKPKAEEEEPKEDTWLAVIGGDVHTGTGALLRGATVLAKNGVIEEIGYDPWIPEKAERLDAKGLSVYPGLIAIEINPNILQSGDGSVAEEDAHGHGELDPAALALELFSLAGRVDGTKAPVEDSYDPFGQGLLLTLSAGITSALVGNAAIKLKRGEIDDLVMSEDRLETFAWSHRNPAGKRALREKFTAASAYLREYRAWEATKKDEAKEPSSKEIDRRVLAVLRGEVRAKFPASEVTDLLAIARFAVEFDFRPVIQGCQEGWIVADELGRAGASAILTPREYRSPAEELVRESGSTIENAAILHRHGVQVAIIPTNTSIDLGGIMGHDLLSLPIEAAFAVRGGLSEQAALEAVTLVPARLLGISHRVGTLEPGKDCDLIVTDGDWLHYETFVQYAVVAGKVAYDKQKEVFFSHIRPRAVAEETEPEAEAEPAAPAETSDETPDDTPDETPPEDPPDGDEPEPEDEESGEG